jgi:hypothetical protein
MFICSACILFIYLIYLVSGKDGTYETLDGIEFVFEIPVVKPVGVVFFAHGCSHSSTDFWPKSAACPKCIGLPVERDLVEQSLKLGLIALAVSSANRVQKCWGQKDPANVEKVLKHLYYLNFNFDNSTQIPLFLYGASSGGSFVGFFSEWVRSKGIHVAGNIIVISTLNFVGTSDKRANFDYSTPTVFIHMPKDVDMSESIEVNLKILKKAGTFVNEFKVDSKPLSPDFFTYQNVLTSEQSLSFIEALKIKKNAFLDEHGFLINDPRGTDWRVVGRLYEL